jgi:hypothetical protein
MVRKDRQFGEKGQTILRGEDDTEWIGELIKTRNVEVLRVLPKSKRAKLSDELSRSLRLILM